MLREMTSYEVEEWSAYFAQKASQAEMAALKEKMKGELGVDSLFGSGGS